MINNITPEDRKVNPFVILGIVLAMQMVCTFYCIHRVDRATKTAAREIYDSLLNRVDDTLQMNEGELQDAGRKEDSL